MIAVASCKLANGSQEERGLNGRAIKWAELTLLGMIG